MSYRVKLTREAEDDLLRLYDFVLERELDRVGGGDLAVADRAIVALQDGFATLRSSPFTCRKADQSPFLRELVIPFGGTGYIALFEIADNNTVIIAAVRHQREDDYH
ncbi:type II toxin-antitoxin system RelE/ParE family toxin [Rhodoferax sp. UBA5149]|uniref:type II toxin-antitoxin system RelE/ParE family toxin n=1 Tax=Rhodoferax sp. UBA5149 TaxID=1947379 RepID=UPI0025FDF5F4|nr:type II toxin-antitoxin system RelE/ParE family toxin [Rhodoferax sp. UBA5149]